MQVSGIVSKRAFNESTVKYSSQHSCNTAHSKSIWSMVTVWPQWWQTVSGHRDKIWDLVDLALMLALRYRDLCHLQPHTTWFDPISECRSWPDASHLYRGYLPVGLYLDRGSHLLVGLLFHFLQCHSGLVSSRNEHVCPCHSITWAGSWYGK